MRPENTPDLIERARQFAIEKPSVSYIQRKLGIGYNQACELMEHFEQRGIVSKPNSAGVRTVLNGNTSATTDKEINRATINAFLARCINRGAAMALDAEYGLRVVSALVTDNQSVRVDLDNGHILFLDVEHLVPRDPMDPQRFFDAMNKGKPVDARS